MGNMCEMLDRMTREGLIEKWHLEVRETRGDWKVIQAEGAINTWRQESNWRTDGQQAGPCGMLEKSGGGVQVGVG